ncbi:hypothetical protein [Halovulum sp. GXIMD14793]
MTASNKSPQKQPNRKPAAQGLARSAHLITVEAALNLEGGHFMTNSPRFFGFWLPVYDEKTAREAVKMSGLPVLVMGGNAALFALISAVGPTPSYGLATCFAAISLVLIVLAFRIRAGWASAVPIMMTLFVIFVVLNIYLSLTDYRLSGGGGVNAVRITLAWVIPAFCTALAFGGWRWLQKNRPTEQH